MTLPYQSMQFVEECFEEYTPIMNNVSVANFIKRYNDTVNIDCRIAIESQK